MTSPLHTFGSPQNPLEVGQVIFHFKLRKQELGKLTNLLEVSQTVNGKAETSYDIT
jgi:hypothetical protein